MSHFPFRGSPSNIQTTTPPSPPPTSMAVTTSVPARSSSPCSAASGPPNSRCCDTGRPLFTDPITGQSVCSCQYEMMGYQRLAGLPGGMPALSMYSNAYPEGFPPYLPALGAEQAPFYPSPAGALDLKENLAAAGGAPWPYPAVYPYDAAFAGYPFNGYGMDLNGARRKNATRETTSTLKAWLNEHKKNPYPTKGEKIMLAIITKMTLTQVSTWFANARRRLKKENKMTWEPRNRVDDDDANLDDDDKSTDGKDLLDSKDSGTGSSEDGDRPSNRLEMLDRTERGGDGRDSEWSESRPGSGPGSPEMFDRPPMGHPHPLLHPAALHHFRPPMGHPADALLHHHHQVLQQQQQQQHAASAGASTNTTNVISKPRIWSLADMASKETVAAPNGPSKDSSEAGLNSNISSSPGGNNNGRSFSPNGGGGGGKIVSPLAGRLSMHGSPYIRPEFYRNFYPQGAGPMPNGNTSAEAALLESYQRTFGGLGPNGLPMHHPLNTMMSKVSAAGPQQHFAPLSLTTSPAAAHSSANNNNNHNSSQGANPGGVSPSASSTSSIADGPVNVVSDSKCNSNSNGSSTSPRSPIDVVSKP